MSANTLIEQIFKDEPSIDNKVFQSFLINESTLKVLYHPPSQFSTAFSFPNLQVGRLTEQQVAQLAGSLYRLALLATSVRNTVAIAASEAGSDKDMVVQGMSSTV